MNTRKIDDLAAKVDLLLKNNQNQIYVMEETNLEPGITEGAAVTETSEEDQQEVSYVNGQGWQFRTTIQTLMKIDDLAAKVDLLLKNNQNKIYVMEETNLEPGTTDAAAETETSEEDHQAQKQFQNRQNNPQTAPATASGQPDELKRMMQQLLQGQQIQGKALNQVTNEINTRMDNMFTELNSKYDAVASHIRMMDVQISQTAETIKRQHGTLPGKTNKNPKDCNTVELRSGRHLPDPVPKKLTAKEKGKQKDGEQPEDVLDDEQDAEQPAVIEPVALTTPDWRVPACVYTPKVSYPVPAKKSRKDCEEMKCKKMLEELNVKLSLMDAIQMIPSMRSLLKGLISEKTSADSDIMMNAALTPQEGMIEEILADDPLEVALIRAESEQNTCNIDADGDKKMLDSNESIEKTVAFLSLGRRADSSINNRTMAPRRTKMASMIKAPYARGEPEDDTVSPTHPWPREEGTEISLTDPNIPAKSEERWDKEASRRYKSLLNINILPTRFVNAGALNDLGLHEDLHAVLQVLGIADLCHITYPLYPDLVRQVLATAELTFKRPDFPIFEEASFTFFASGVKHSISLEKLTEIYEISEETRSTLMLMGTKRC
ncbi:hypothetical protein F2Q70_00002060 [Brassica cretica]|uniref:Arabidopsis retrotransposon Orf1 C-terminal domain-containing protein n=1 Tax=Brassica cretica TaxID=69181 RepID=A0A8S9IR78_BRACR|nr:hypothetical protein F2Q70_00002060 [Brassica cretica]